MATTGIFTVSPTKIVLVITSLVRVPLLNAEQRSGVFLDMVMEALNSFEDDVGAEPSVVQRRVIPDSMVGGLMVTPFSS